MPTGYRRSIKGPDQPLTGNIAIRHHLVNAAPIFAKMNAAWLLLAKPP